MQLIHCSYHKCLTVYYSKVISALYNKAFKFSKGYQHYNSLLDDFHSSSNTFKISSINNHAIDLNKLESDVRISRFIRDPRDLVVSGYFYHKRGAEPWSKRINPTSGDWKVVNGCIPRGMGKDHSFSSYLQTLNTEDGLIAEIEFRANHFDSMLAWTTEDPRIKTYKYEELLGNEKNTFVDIIKFYGGSWIEQKTASLLAERFSAKNQKNKTQHIRNSATSQWQQHFTPKVEQFFLQRYAAILEHYGYE